MSAGMNMPEHDPLHGVVENYCARQNITGADVTVVPAVFLQLLQESGRSEEQAQLDLELCLGLGAPIVLERRKLHVTKQPE